MGRNLGGLPRALCAAGAGVALALAAPGTARADAGDLKVFDWSGYEDENFYLGYKEKHGGAPSYTYFASQEEGYNKLRAGFEADLAHPCTDGVVKWADSGLLQPIDTARLENWDDLIPTIRDVKGIRHDGKTWMVPFDWGNTGLIYRTDLISEDEIGLRLLASPEYKGKVLVPDSPSSAYAMAALATGTKDWGNITEAQVDRASEFLREVHPNVRFYWSDTGQFDQAIASGEAVMGWAWNQSEINLIGDGQPVRMVKDTDKGVATWVCGYVHLAGATAPDDQVYDLLNALTDAASGKYIIEAWGYAHSNARAYGDVDPALIAQYGFDNPAKFFSGSLVFDPVLNPDLEAKMAKEFERIKSGF